MAVFIAAFAAANVLDPHVTGIISVVCGGLAFAAFLAGAVLGRRKKGRGPRFVLWHGSLLLLAAAVMLGLYAGRYFSGAIEAAKLDQVCAEARMEILDYPTRRYGKFYYPVRILRLDGQPVTPFQVRLSCTEALEGEPCDLVLCRVKFYSFEKKGMYSGFSSQLAEGNLLGAYPEGYDGGYTYIPAKDPFPAGRLLPMLRRYISRGLDRCISGDEAALLKTVLLAQGSQLSDRVYTDFRLIGCSHMLAVSGLHMTLVGAFLNLFLARLPIRRGLRSLMGVFLLFIYLLLTGFPVSAVRSYIMYAFCSLASATYQTGDTLNSLGGAVVLICYLDPFAGGSAGLAMSVLATAGIALLGRQIEELLCPGYGGRVRRYLAGSISTSLSATLFTMPLQVALFRGLPLLTLASNLVLMPIFVAMLYGALPLLILSVLAPAGALIEPFALFCGLLGRLLLRLGGWMARLPGIYLGLEDPVLLAALALAAVAVLAALSIQGRARPVIMVIALGLALFLPALRGETRRDAVTLAVSGDSESACVVVMQGRRAVVLSMGTFNSGLARQILTQENVRSLECVLVTRQDYRSKAMLEDLMWGYRPNTVLLYGRPYGGKDLRYPDVKLETGRESCIYQVLPGVMLQVEEDGAKVRVWANNRKLLLVQDECSKEDCDLLITNRSLPQIDTEFTIFMCGEETPPEEAAMGLYSDFILVTDQEVNYTDIPFGGEMSARGW